MIEQARGVEGGPELWLEFQPLPVSSPPVTHYYLVLLEGFAALS